MAANQTGYESSSREPEQLARMAHSVTHSIRTRARAGASGEDLTEIANSFMAVLFPSPKTTSTTQSTPSPDGLDKHSEG